MPVLNGGEALIQSLYRAGIRAVFGIPGLGQYEAVDALYNAPEIRYVTVRNEQAASYMADGYARATGEIAAALVVPGPGVLNASAGMATAFAASSPILVITGTDHQREGWDDARNPPLLHALTKWTARAQAVEEIPQLVQTAMHELRSGRPRPVALEIPQEVLAARGSVDLNAATVALPAPPAADPHALQQAIQWMAAAQQPLIWAGGGVHIADAHAQLQTLAESWCAPVMTGRSGKGALSDRHPLALGFGELRYAPLRRRLDESDVVLVVGASQDFSRHPGKVIYVNIDPRHLGPQVAQPQKGGDLPGEHLGIAHDARAVLDALLAHTADFARPDASTRQEVEKTVATLNQARFAPDQQLQPQADTMAAVRAALPDNAILATDMTQLGYYSRNYYPVYAPRSYFTCTRLWTLGAAWPMALGAAVGEQQLAGSAHSGTRSAERISERAARPVVAILGDGGFLYNSQELATAVQYNIPAVVIVFNDHAYGNVLRAQQEEFDGHVIGTRLHNPDFIQLAESYGVWNRRVDDAAALQRALEDALDATMAESKPALIEMPVGPMQRIF